MKDPAVLVLEPESSGLDLLPAASGLGFGVHVLDRRPLAQTPHAVRHAVARGNAAYHRVETRSVPAVLEAARHLARTGEVAAVLPGFEYSVPAAAVVARELGLRGVAPETAAGLRDKARMKELLATAGVPVAPGSPLAAGRADEGTLRAIARQVAFPAVVKPVDGAGSLGVRRVDDYDALRDHLTRIHAGLLEDMGLRVGERLLVEAYVAGPEFSVEGFVGADGVTVLAVTEKRLGPEPYFVEVGHIVEADIARTDRAALHTLAETAVRALGLTYGVFHLEARLTSGGPVVLEVAARMGGDRIPRLVSAAHGRNLPEIMVRCLAGLPVAPPGTRNGTGQVCAVRFLTVTEPSRLTDPGALRRALSALSGCLEVELDCPPGATLQPARDFRQRFGHLVVTAPDHGRLDALLDEADRLVRTVLEGDAHAHSDHQSVG